MECGPQGSKLGEESKKSSTQTGRCQKTRGFATTSDQDYEVALCCLIFLRALRHASDFFLVSNYAPAGKFDDVVLFYRNKEDQDSWYRAILLQAKHKENPAEKKLTSSNPFRLKKYLDSFKDIRNLWEQTVNVPNKQIHFQEISLVLYSNARCENGDTAHDVTASPDVKHLSDFLNTGGRLLRISDAQRAGLPEGPETCDFIQHLILCIQQVSVHKLDQTLQEEISNVLRLTSLDVAKKLIADMTHMVKEWWQEEGEVRYLTSQSEEWRNILEMQVTRLNADTLKVQKQLNLDFCEAGLEEIKSVIDRTQIWIFVRDKYHAAATRLRLLKALMCCLVLDDKFDASQFDEVEALWGTDVCSTLVLDVSGDSPEELSLLQRLQRAIINHDSRKLVVISKEKPKIAEWFVFEAENTWSVLDHATRERLLSVKIDLQGNVVALRDVVGSETSFIIADEIIHLICDPAKEMLKLGVSIPPQLEYYVPRCMQRIYTKKITYDILNKTRTLIFWKNFLSFTPMIFSKIKLLPLSLLKGENRVAESALIFEECSDFVIRDLCCRLCVCGISGDIGEEGLENTIVEFLPCTFICEEKIIVLEGVPGVGKSSFVTAMCSSVKERFPGSWVFRVDMGKDCDFISETGFTHTSDIKAFLLRGLNKDLHCLERDLLDHSLYVAGNVFIFLDAFDEMSPNFTAKCCDLLKKIVTMVKYRQIVVTTRPITSRQVEEALGTKAFHLPVFSRDEQKLFLERFCKVRGKNVNYEEISALHHSAVDVLEIPFHCKLAVEVLLHCDDQKFLKFLNPWKKVLLYQKFVKQSINLRLVEKFGLHVSKPGAENILEHLANKHVDDLQALAVRKLNPFNQLSSFINSTNLPDEKLGLVVAAGEGVDFEHYTFAEYFLGRWLARHWQECPKQLLLEMFCHGGYEFTLQTMSWFLFEDFPLHKAVAQGDVEAVRQLRSSGTTDRGGRSALHVAAMTEGKQDEVVDLLMTKDKATNKNDHILASHAVKYAEMFRNWKFFDAVLRNGKKLEGLNFITDSNSVINVLIQITGQDLAALFQYIIGVHKEMIHRVDVKGNTLLHIAATTNSSSIVKILTEKQPEVNIRNYQGDSPLHLAAAFGCKDAAMVLLEVGADPNIQTVLGVTALMRAADKGHLGIVKLLIKKGVDPNIKNEIGQTALTFAATQGHLEIVKVLIENGANINVKYNDYLFLMFAAFHFPGNTKQTINKGAIRKLIDACKLTALTLAITPGHLEVVKLLIEKGADPNIRAVGGKTALMMAACLGSLQIVKLLFEKGVDPNIKNEDGKTALMDAAVQGHLEVLKFLLENGADPSVKDKDGVTALMLAADNGHLKIVKLLLQKGVNPSIRDKDGKTALIVAANKGCLEIVNLLLDKGVDTNITSRNGATALMLATVEGHLELVKLLIDKGGDPKIKDKYGVTTLMQAALRGHLEIVKVLLDKGVDPSIKNKDGATALMMAAYIGNLEIVKLLLEKGADPTMKGNNGITALMIATFEGHLEIVKGLLDKGVDPSIKNKDGVTALMTAALRGHLEIVKVLLDKGVDPSIKNKDGVTALMMAAYIGNLEIVKLLIEKGADPTMKGNNGITAMMYAGRNGHRDVVKLLIEYVRNIGSKD